MSKILVLEDEESVNRGICFTLAKEGYEVISCNRVQDAKAGYVRESPELLICDINLPDGSGLDFITWVRQKSKAYIICLTAKDSEMDYVMGYGAGADDYVAKPFSLSVLMLKIQAFFLRKGIEESPDMIYSGDISVCFSKMLVLKNKEEIICTKNEWKLLVLFLQHPNQILSKNQILEQLFDSEGDFVDENTIAVNIRRLREKIEKDPSKPEYIKNIRGMGYIWVKECDKFV